MDYGVSKYMKEHTLPMLYVIFSVLKKSSIFKFFNSAQCL